INGGIVGATFFSCREYLVSPFLLSALADTSYSRRIREIQEQRASGVRTGEKLGWWDMRMYRVPDTALSGAFTGAVLNAWRRGRTGIVPGITTGGIVCAIIQFAFNEVGVARVKYISKKLRAQQEPTRAPIASSSSPSGSVDASPWTARLDRLLTLFGFTRMSDEEYVTKLKAKRASYLEQIADLEKQVEEENKSKKSGSHTGS
ncbi:uncharacterized protein LAESUDRAFT_646500, partial [Laetiporus sulphureus 93-53]